MAAKKQCLMIGAGGMAGGWIRHFFPNFKDRMEIVGLVEIRPEVLKDQGDWLGLSDAQRFAKMEDAFEAVSADFCTIVIPPAYHRQAAVGGGRLGAGVLVGKIAIEQQLGTAQQTVALCCQPGAKQGEITPVGRQGVPGQAFFQPQGIAEIVDLGEVS